MNAIELLNEQHDEIDVLFAKAVTATSEQGKEHLFIKLADALVIHTTLEEKIFYPAVRLKRTAEILYEALEEHLGIKRILNDMLDLDPTDETFDAKLDVLREQVEHHVGEERRDLFPKVRKLLTADHLEKLGTEMALMEQMLEGTAPRNRVRTETAEAAGLF